MNLASIRKWFRSRNWLDNLARLQELLQEKAPERPRWWPTLALEVLEARWVPAPIQFFYIPLPEAAMRTAFASINTAGTATGNDITSFVNIAATENGTILHYDQWEDGYETNLNNPLQASTQVWGDGNPANGSWPGAPIGTDPAIVAGQVIRLRNDIPANPRVPANLFFDGGDKIGANRTVSVARAQFPVTPGSVIASAVEVRDTRFFDTSYVSPVGTNTPNAGNMFSYTAFSVMASHDNTVVQIDRDNNGTFEQTATLNQGQSVVSATNVLQGGRVVASKPVQVQLVTGDIGGVYASRSYTLYPTSQLANDYFTPVGLVNASFPVGLYVYNPNPGSITVNFETRSTSGTLGSIPSGTGVRFLVPGGSTGARLFTTGGETFAALGTGDTPGTTYDWSFSLQPRSSLSQIALVALGVGNSNNPPTTNTSPIWVTPLPTSPATTRVYVDYDGNPATGPLTDPLGNQYNVHFDLARLQSQQVRDPDNDNSGMRLYTVDGTLISTAWGEDANTATVSAPGFDAGTTIPAVPVPEFFKLADFAPGGDLNNDGFFSSGDVVRYTLRIRHIGTTPISNALVTDTLPPEVTYLANSTNIDQGGGPIAITDGGGGTLFPLDFGGFNIANLAPGGTTFLSFDVTINTGLPAGTRELTNRSLLTFDIFRLPAVNTIQLRGAIGDRIWHDLDADGVQDAGEPGIPAVGLTLTWFGPDGVVGGTDNQTFTTTTDASGNYNVGGLPAGNFSLSVNPATLPDNVAPTFDLDGVGTVNVALLSLTAAQQRADADFGYRGNATIGDRVWYDANGDGVQQVGAVTEPGIVGATVTLLFGGDDGDLTTATDNITYTTTTGANGLYTFANLFGGDVNAANPNYRVSVTPPAAFAVQTFDATAPTTDSSSTLQLSNGGTNALQDFGYRGTASFGDRVWEDSNGNGVQDGGEPGIDGISVQLLDAGGTVIAATTTAGGGLYSFPGLVAGNYSLVFGTANLTTTYVRTVANRGADDTVDSDADAATGATTPIALAAGEANTTVDAGLYSLASVGNRVWNDADGDGVQDGGEPGLNSVTVLLDYAGLDGVFGTGDDQLAVATQVASGDGNYTFANRVPGTYRIRIDTATLPASIDFPTFDLDGTATANAATFPLTSGQTRTDADFGYSQVASLSGRAWIDADGDGAPDAIAQEPGLPGVGVTLTWAGPNGTFGDGDDQIIGTAPTDALGNYTFVNLPQGNYRADVVSASVPGNATQTFDLNGPLDNSALRTLAPGEDATGVDFGYVGTASIGRTVWYDADGDGAQNNAEPGIAGAAVSLLWGGPDGDLATATDNVTFTTTTDANGNYTFPGLPVNGATDPYRATVTPPAAFTSRSFDADGVGTPDQSTLALGANEANVGQNFGYGGTASFGDFVWQDANGNGRQDVGEPGIDGIAVDLFDAGGTNLLASTVAAGGGAYSFPGLIAGTYQIRFGSANGATTFTRTTANLGSEAGDSDADAATGFTGPLTIADGATNTDVDAGLFIPVTLGDTVYLDANANGVQDAGEPGISNVAVIVTWFGPDGAPGGGDDVVSLPVSTDASGNWTFGGLPPGNYTVSAATPAASGFNTLTDSIDDGAVNAANPVAITATSGAVRGDIDFGFRGTGSIGSTVWHDRNGNGTQDTGEPGIPAATVQATWFGSDGALGTADDATFTATADANGTYSIGNLPAGNFRVNVLTASLPDNATPTFDLDGVATANTVALALLAAQARTDANFGYTGNANIGDRVWYDVDGDGVQDASAADGFEPGIVGATVTLLFGGDDGDLSTTADNITYTTTTGANGLYSFPGLFGGDINGANPNYRVSATPAAGFPSQTFDATAPTTDSTSTLQLAAGATNALQDFGYRGPLTQGIGSFVWDDQNGNGVQDGGEPGIDGVAVELLDSAGTVLDATTTSGGGQYSFAGLADTATFGTYSVRFGTAPTFARTAANIGGDDAIDSDGDAATGLTGPIAVLSGAFNDDVDQGLYVPVSLGGRVWYDLDADGTQDAGEPGIPNASITVTWFGPDGAPGGGDDVMSLTVGSNANGDWTVVDLPPGNYSVPVATLPPGLVPTFDLDGIATPDVALVSATSGTNRTDVDFGYTGTGSIGDRVFLDVNSNGTFDAGEGLSGAEVALAGDLNDDGTDDILTTTTGADGFYQFTNLRTNGIGLQYTLTVDPTTLPRTGTGIALPNTVDPDGPAVGNNASSLRLFTQSPSDQTQDFGYRGFGQIGNTVFLDANNNGTPDAGEGISGAAVTLTADLDGDGVPETFTTTTNASGTYLFTGLPAETPAGVSIPYTIAVNGNFIALDLTNTVDPDGPTPGDGSSVTAIDPLNPVNLTQNFGFRGPGSIGDRVFLDFDGDGAFAPGEGLAGLTVTLTADVNGDGVNETFTATTDADGFYQFTGLPVYLSDESTPVDYSVTVQIAIPGLTNSIDPDGGNDSTWVGNLTDAQTLDDIDFGYVGTGAIGQRVWIDSNGDGVQGPLAGEPGLPGVGFTLTWAGPNGTFGDADDATTTTTGDSAGTYGFGNLPSGSFRIDVNAATVPGNMAPTFDLDGIVTANAAVATLAVGETRTDANFGYRGSAGVGGTVWIDEDRDGTRAATENGIPGATVVLVWSGPDGDPTTTADNVTFTTTSDANGDYAFPGLPVIGASDVYSSTVTALPIPGFVPTFDLDSGTIAPDQTTSVTVGANQTRTDVNFGYDGTGSLSGTAFRDDDNDGVQDAGEPGIAGVVVALAGLDPFGNPVRDPATGQPYVAVTDANGNYSFTTLIPGVYSLTETQPAAYSDGLDTAGTLGGNGGNDVVSGIAVGPGASGTGYTFGERGAAIAGTVFTDANRDGTQQPGEPGIPNVTIELRDPITNALIATTTTDASGNYTFPNLPAGNYRIVELQPANYGDSPIGPATTRDVTVTPAGLAGLNFAETLGSLSGAVYLDANANGQRDAGEPGLSGVNIQLVGTVQAGVFAISLTTDTLGNFTFDNLIPASYRLTESQPAGYGQGTNAVGTVNGTPNGTVGPVTDWLSGIALNAGAVGIDYRFGELAPANGPSITGTVFLDRNRDGAPGGTGETGLGGVAIQLLDSTGIAVAATTTNPDGTYAFTNVAPGNYTIVESQPAGYGSSTPNVLAATVPATGLAGQNFGETLGGLSGAVYFDSNRDGTRQAGEVGIAGVTVTLAGIDTSGTAQTFTAITDASGNYTFTDVPAGTYMLTEAQPTLYNDGLDSVGSAGGLPTAPDTIAAIPIGAGAAVAGYDFGEVGVGLFGTAFRDDNRDGVPQAGEPGIPGVTIQLIAQNGTVFAVTTTDANGNYTFPNVPGGTYTLVEIQPAGYGDSPTGPFAPNARQIAFGTSVLPPQNFGDTLSTLGGSVFVDANGNGTRDPGETGIGGVPIRLDSAGPDGSFGTADDATGFRTTTTDANGDYTFTNLPNGLYRAVEPTQPPFYGDGPERAGTAGGDTGTNDQIGNIPLAAGTDITGYTFAELSPAQPGTSFISGTVYLDTNGNGTQDPGEPGLPNVTVSTFSGGIIPPSFTITDANGNYTLPNLNINLVFTVSAGQPPEYASGPENAGNTANVLVVAQGTSGVNFGETPARIGGTVYFDADASGTFNAGDATLSGVSLTLQDGNGNPVNDLVTGQPYVLTSAPDGTYAFTNLAAGNYRVIETQPAGYSQGTNSPGTGSTLGGTDRIDVTLAAGAVSNGNTFGELGNGVGGTVWLDSNGDGIRQPAETVGVGGALIALLDGNGNVVRTTTTAPDGSYSFANLPPGLYTLVETQPNAYGSSTANVVPLDLRTGSATDQNFGETLGSLSGNVFADTNGNGLRDAGEPGVPNVTLTLTGTDVNGNAVTLFTTTNANGDYIFLAVPAGTYTATETQPPAFGDGPDSVGSAGGALAPTDSIIRIPLGSGAAIGAYNFAEITSVISGTVYRDFNLDGTFNTNGANPDTGIAGITIALTGTDLGGQPVNLTTTTAADGTYSFTGLGGGTYTLTQTQPPLPTTLTNGFYDGADNLGSANGTILVKNSMTFTLAAQQNGTGYNFGELPPADPFGFVYADLNRNGVRDAGEPGIPGVAVTIGGTAFAGTQFARPITGADIPGGSLTLLTDANGLWQFNPIPPGLYSITETQPAGFADGAEEDADPNGPPTTIGNDVFSNMLLAPFPIRGPFNFGEIQRAGPPGPLPPFDFFPPPAVDLSKRQALGSTPVALPAPVLPTTPNFAAFNPSAARPTAFAVVGEDLGGGWLRVFDFGAGNERFRFQPFGSFTGGVRAVSADVNADGIPDIIAVPGPGGGPVVKVFDGDTGAEIRSLLAFEPEFRGGLRVAAADLNGDFVADLIVTPDSGGGPIVRAFDGATGAVLANFFALDATFRGGLRIAAGDVNRDGVGDLLVTAGPGGGPRVAGYDGRFLATTQAKLFNDFFAFAPELRSGFWISAGDVDGDGFADVLLGAGEGGGPRVVAYNGQPLSLGNGPLELASFFAGDPSTRNGARVAALDLDGDGRAEVLAGGSLGLPTTYIYNPLTGAVRDTFYSFPVVSLGGVSIG